MKCPYDRPTISDCGKCPFEDCVRPETADVQVYVKRWQEKNPEKVKQYQKNKRARFSPEKKRSELQRLAEWKKNNQAKVKQSIKRCGKRWRKAHREEERERNRRNYLKKRERQAV